MGDCGIRATRGNLGPAGGLSGKSDEAAAGSQVRSSAQLFDLLRLGATSLRCDLAMENGPSRTATVRSSGDLRRVCSVKAAGESKGRGTAAPGRRPFPRLLTLFPNATEGWLADAE
jgi:hypothetical protein